MDIKNYINKLFEKSLFIETILNQPSVLLENKGMLLERHGILNNMDMYIKRFKKFLKENEDLQGENFVWNDNIFEDIPDCFFNELVLRFKWNKGNKVGGGVVTNMTLADNKKLECLEIEFRVGTNISWDDVIKSTTNTLAHELTHAWEGFQRLYHEKKSLYDVHNDVSYDKVFNPDENKNYKDIISRNLSFISYYLLDFELSAYIGSIYSSLLEVAHTWNCPEEGLGYFQENKTYQKYIDVGQYIKLLKDFPEQSEMIEKTWIDLGNAPLPYKKIIKKLEFVYEKRLKRLRNTVAKMVYDLYVQTRNTNVNDE